MANNRPKIVSIVGARPQFIKLAPLAMVMPNEWAHIIVHTGQHYDTNMSNIFFEQLEIPAPEVNLEIAETLHGAQTGRMLVEIERQLLAERPNMVLVFGDTNSTLAGALAASKLHIPTAHIEAGLRSFDRDMPEEINRVAVDHMSDLLLCPTQQAVANLSKEGLSDAAVLTGDLMYDATLSFRKKAHEMNIWAQYLKKVGPWPTQDDYMLLTLHRASNVDKKPVLKGILNTLGESRKSIVWPIHPRTKKQLESFDLTVPDNIILSEPVGYLEMIELVTHSNAVITDSGGLQKEAFFLRKPCITLRDTTEWVETVDAGANTLGMMTSAKIDREKVLSTINQPQFPNSPPSPYGEGDAAQKIYSQLCDFLSDRTC